MTDSIKLADLPDDALSAIVASPHALDDEVLYAVADEFDRRAKDKQAHAASICKFVAARRGDNIVVVAPGQR